MPVRFKEILDAFELIGATGGYEFRAVLCRETGKIYTHSDYPDFEDLDDLPDDVDDEEKYVNIPDRGELDRGKGVARLERNEFDRTDRVTHGSWRAPYPAAIELIR